MLDFVIGVYLAVLVVRGWARGFVREALDLVGLVLGVAVAFRLSAPIGDYLSDHFDVTPEWARIGAGVVLFLLVGLALGLVASWLSKLMRLPGLNLTNRILGAALGAAWGLVLLVLLASLARALPLPVGADRAVSESRVLAAVTGPDSISQRAIQLTGDAVLDSVLALERLVGSKRLILDSDDRMEIEPAAESEIRRDATDAQLLFTLVNQERVGAGLAPLAWSEGLAEVAAEHAEEMYLDGYVAHRSPETGTVADRMGAAGLRLRLVGENLALASSVRAAHDGLMESPAHRENLLDPDFDRIGVAVVEGPVGVMVVQVFAG